MKIILLFLIYALGSLAFESLSPSSSDSDSDQSEWNYEEDPMLNGEYYQGDLIYGVYSNMNQATNECSSYGCFEEYFKKSMRELRNFSNKYCRNKYFEDKPSSMNKCNCCVNSLDMFLDRVGNWDSIIKRIIRKDPNNLIQNYRDNCPRNCDLETV